MNRSVCAIAVMAAVTLGVRVLPFLIFREKKTPQYISFLSEYLPYSIMGMLVVYCLKDVSFIRPPHGIPEAVAVILTATLHAFKKNTLLSIIGGTACYMLLLSL